MALNKLKKWIGTQAMTAFFDQLNDNVDATNAAIDLAESIAEYGSNANGEYWKFPSGLLICTQVLTATSTENETFGSLYFIRYGPWTYPHAFATPPHSSTSAVSTAQITASREIGTSNITEAYGYRGTAFNESSIPHMTISIEAIGRWK